MNKNQIKSKSIDLDFVVRDNPLKFSRKTIEKFINKIEIISINASKIEVKYLIFPFLKNSSPNGKLKRDKHILILMKYEKKSQISYLY